MSEVSGSNPNPIQRQKYEQEYKHGIDLFQKALKSYKASDNPFQQEEFKGVMDQALNVLNETASELARQELQKYNAEISKDYAALQQSPNSEAALEKLSKDLSQAKRNV